ncbi:MAG: AI-2E family transporter [Ignavibacteriales bacterium]|nr:AI-2E family transporter [Ignavibacteriales bacterium]
MPRHKKNIVQTSAEEVEPVPIPTSALDVVVITAGLVLLIVLLYTLEALISPILIIGVIIALLYPLRENKVAKNIIVLSGGLFLVWFMYTVEEILAPFILSLFFAYLLHPIVTQLETSWKIPRWTSAVFIICCVIALVIVLLVLGLPHIIAQFEGILQSIGVISTQFVEWVLDGRFIKVMQKYGIQSDQLRSLLTTTIAPRVEDILKGLLKGTFGIVSGLQVIVTGIVNIVIIPFLTFFLLKDFPLVRHRVKMMIPKKRREQSVQFYHRVDQILGRYIRGTTIIAILDACVVSIGLTLIGIQYPIVIGILSGLLFFVPYFGFITILSVSAFVASLSMGALALPVISTVSFLAVLHIIEVYVLTPMLIGEKIGLHPVVLILSLFLFGYFLGFIGLLISIPAAAIIIVSIKEWETNRKKELKLEGEV